MIRKILISCGIAFAALTAKATTDDSIKVVKGQVSDYYITVTQDRIVKDTYWTVTDNRLKVLQSCSLQVPCTIPLPTTAALPSKERRMTYICMSTIPEKDSEQNPGTG